MAMSPLLAALGGGAAGAGGAGLLGRGASSLFDFMDAPRSAVANALSAAGIMESKDTSLDPMVRASPFAVGLGGLGMGLLAGAGAPVAIPLGIGLGALTQMVGEQINPAMDAPNVETGNPLMDILGNAAIDPMTWAGGFGAGSMSKGAAGRQAVNETVAGRIPGVIDSIPKAPHDYVVDNMMLDMRQALPDKVFNETSGMRPPMPGVMDEAAAAFRYTHPEDLRFPDPRIKDPHYLFNKEEYPIALRDPMLGEAMPERFLGEHSNLPRTIKSDGAGFPIRDTRTLDDFDWAPAQDPLEPGIQQTEMDRRATLQNLRNSEQTDLRLAQLRHDGGSPLSAAIDGGGTNAGGMPAQQQPSTVDYVPEPDYAGFQTGYDTPPSPTLHSGRAQHREGLLDRYGVDVAEPITENVGHFIPPPMLGSGRLDGLGQFVYGGEPTMDFLPSLINETGPLGMPTQQSNNKAIIQALMEQGYSQRALGEAWGTGPSVVRRHLGAGKFRGMPPIPYTGNALPPSQLGPRGTFPFPIPPDTV